MADTLAPVVASPAKKTKASAKKPSHPKTSEMVNRAITELKERGGSSLQAIKKYITANYKVDADKLAPFIKKYLKGAVGTGALVQTKGKGASGSFKLEASKTSKKPAAPSAAKEKKSAAVKLAKKKPVKKVAVKPKKAALVARSSPKKAAKKLAAKPKIPTKAKKTAKPPTKKPKTPKPKKAAAAPKGRPTAKRAAKK